MPYFLKPLNWRRLLSLLSILFLLNISFAQNYSDSKHPISNSFKTGKVHFNASIFGSLVFNQQFVNSFGLANNFTLHHSNFGLQINAQFPKHFSAMLQAISIKNNKTPRTFISNASLKYSITPDFSVLAGRFQTPALLYGQTRYIYYTRPGSIILPSIYNLIPVSYINGGEFKLQSTLGKTGEWAVQIYGGQANRGYFMLDPTFKNIGNVIGVRSSISNHHILFEASALRLKLTSEAGSLSNKNSQLNFISTGLALNFNHFFLNTEFARLVNLNIFNAINSSYLTMGFIFDKWSPSVTFSQLKSSAMTQNIYASRVDLTLGLNYTFNSNLSFDLDASRSNMPFIPTQSLLVSNILDKPAILSGPSGYSALFAINFAF